MQQSAAICHALPTAKSVHQPSRRFLFRYFDIFRRWHKVRNNSCEIKWFQGEMVLSVATDIKQRPQSWQLGLSAGVLGYLTLGAVTGTARPYHWFMLLIIPLAFLAAERCRRFFLDWAPLVAFWLIYDRLRLLQPLLLHRVAVAWPYQLERWVFGDLFGGEVPAHAARVWLAAQSATMVGRH
jgi:hypothetical protein